MKNSESDIKSVYISIMQIFGILLSSILILAFYNLWIPTWYVYTENGERKVFFKMALILSTKLFIFTQAVFLFNLVIARKKRFKKSWLSTISAISSIIGFLVCLLLYVFYSGLSDDSNIFKF